MRAAFINATMGDSFCARVNIIKKGNSESSPTNKYARFNTICEYSVPQSNLTRILHVTRPM